MRVATSMVYSSIRSNLSDIIRGLNDASKTVITGKRINTLSDDPMGMVNATGIKSTLKGLDQLERGLSLGKTWLTASESALTQAQNLVSEAKTLAIQMANSPISSSNRENAAIMVQHHLEQLVSLANTRVGDRYIFSGNHTDTPPFALEADGSIVRKEDGSVRYQGDNQPFAIKTEGGSTLTIGGDGDAVFSRIFDTLANFREALDGGSVTITMGADEGDADTAAGTVDRTRITIGGEALTVVFTDTGYDNWDEIDDLTKLADLLNQQEGLTATKVGDTQLKLETAAGVTLAIADGGILAGSDAVGNVNDVNTAMDALDIDFEDLNSQITAVGSKMIRLDMKFTMYQELKINGTERLSALEDADIIAAITHLEQMQLSYQAALSSSSKLMSTSLLDYLK
jgi:flagellar hook-associated protein 3 FlgL